MLATWKSWNERTICCVTLNITTNRYFISTYSNMQTTGIWHANVLVCTEEGARQESDKQSDRIWRRCMNPNFRKQLNGHTSCDVYIDKGITGVHRALLMEEPSSSSSSSSCFPYIASTSYAGYQWCTWAHDTRPKSTGATRKGALFSRTHAIEPSPTSEQKRTTLLKNNSTDTPTGLEDWLFPDVCSWPTAQVQENLLVRVMSLMRIKLQTC